MKWTNRSDYLTTSVNEMCLEEEINFEEGILNKEFWPDFKRKKYFAGSNFRRALGELVIVFETLNNLTKVSRRFGDF